MAFPRVLHSLGVRLLVPLFATTAAVLAAYAVLGFRSSREHLLGLVQADLDRSSGLIKRATHDGMLLNRKEEVQAMIQRLASAPEVAALRVYDKEGAIVMSARREEMGRRVALGSETCQSCHTEDRRTRDTAVLEQRALARTGDGGEVLRHLSVIENEPACSTAACHAHPADQRVLGVLDLEMSMAPLEAALGTARRQFLWTTLALLAVLGAVVAVFLRVLVQRPVLQLCQATRRIAEGDLDTRLEIRGKHELARLAEAFNRMADDLRAARHEVLQWSQTLEEKVVQKSQELRRAERQVLHMEKMASLGRLSATVAHEINNPLSGILAYARLVHRELEELPLDAAARERLVGYLGWMEKECTRCGSIVQNLLAFARRTGGTFAAVDLEELLERSLMLVRHHLEISGIRLRKEYHAENRQIVADAGQIQQALVALLVNAVEAMNSSGAEYGELTVRLCGGEDQVAIEIADTGVGIPPEVLPHIFEPFFSTKEKETGVGLGLAVVYGIVQRHAGRIEVESRPGCGSLFRVLLPRRPPAHMAGASAAPSCASAGPAPAASQGSGHG